MDGRERREEEKELQKQGGWTDEKEEKRKKSWRCRRRNKIKFDKSVFRSYGARNPEEKKLEETGIDPVTSRMRNARSTI